MRLHDRVIRAGFFNHARFVLSFTRDERLFYEGLMLLADDSHCLLDDPWEFKLHLFPVDADITPETLAGWREKFVRAGKLVPYVSQGKQCLYLANGPEHQSQQQNLERPEVPLPSWVRWKPYPKNPYRGAYEFGEPQSVGGGSLSDPTLRPKQGGAEVEAWVSTGLGLNQDWDREGDTGEPSPEAATDSPATTSVVFPPPAAAGVRGEGQGEPSTPDTPSTPEPIAPADGNDPQEESGDDHGEEDSATDPLVHALSRLRRLPRYKAREDDLPWLAVVSGDCPGVDLAREIGKCADWYAPKDAKPNAKAANWRSRVRNWASRESSRGAPARASPQGPQYRRLEDKPFWSASDGGGEEVAVGAGPTNAHGR